MSKDIHVKYIIETTETFLVHLITDLNEAGARDIMPAPAMMLQVLDEVMLALRQSMDSESNMIMRSDNTAEEKKQYVDSMTDAIIEQSFEILGEHLPIQIQGVTGVAKKDIPTVMAAIEEAKGTLQ